MVGHFAGGGLAFRVDYIQGHPFEPASEEQTFDLQGHPLWLVNLYNVRLRVAHGSVGSVLWWRGYLW